MAVKELSLDDIIRFNATRESRSMRTRDIRKITKPYQFREVVFTCSNGWHIESLPPIDFAVEGYFMGHCLGTAKWQAYYKAQGHHFFSLREPDGTPHATIKGNEVFGRGNTGPREEYLKLVQEWNKQARVCSGWGRVADNDVQYHEQGKLDDRDYRDHPDAVSYRGEDWRAKRYV